MQFEPRTVRDLIANYILGPTPGIVANLAAAAGVSEEEMRAALRAFSGSDAPRTRNTWPLPNPGDPSTKIEEWLLGVDSFGIKLMRLYFRAQGDAHRAQPPKVGSAA